MKLVRLKKPTLPQILVFALAIILIIASTIAGLLYQKYVLLAQNPDQIIKQEKEKQVKELAKHITVPPGELPEINTVINVAQYASDPFLSKAQEGDQLFVFKLANRAILYRPSEQLVVDVTTIHAQPGGAAGQKPGQGQPAAPKVRPRVVIYNGSGDAEQVATVKSQLMAAFPDQLDFIGEPVTAKEHYPATIIVDLTEAQTAAAQQMADKIGSTVAPFPKTEKRPDADFLIIVGSSQ
jgi:hypothetical protein